MGATRDDFIKYPRTPHLFGSKGADDDRHLGRKKSEMFIADATQKGGKVKALAVSWHERLDVLPDVQTYAEAGHADLNDPSWFGLVAPKSTPPEQIARVQKAIAAALKPQVAVITPARRVWFSPQEGPSGSLGAGVLLKAGPSGYLFATAHHVVDGENWRSGTNSRALVAMASGVWAGATVVARHKYLDVVLLWVPRQSGHGDFIQPPDASLFFHEESK